MKNQKETMVNRLIYGNKFVITCVVFFIATALDTVIYLIGGIEETSFQHLIMRLIVCAIPIYSLSVFKHFLNLPLHIVLLIHYAITCGLVIFVTFLWSFAAELHPNAYIDIFRSFSMMYAIIFFSAFFIDIFRTKRANRELRQLNGTNTES